MQAIAKPDGRDMSVTDVPFNWNAQFDIKKLKVGIIQDSFDDISNASAKANAQKTLETLRGLGITQFIPVIVPEFSANISGLNIERTAYFDEHLRAGRMKGTRGGNSQGGRLVSAPDYLQQQRARMMMMIELAKATSHVDVYVVGSNNTGVGGPGPRAAGAPATPPAGAAAASAVADAASFCDGECRGLSGDQPAEWLCRHRQPDQRRDLRAAVSRAGDHRAGQGLSGCRRLPPAKADQAGRADDHASAGMIGVRSRKSLFGMIGDRSTRAGRKPRPVPNHPFV